MFWAAEQISRSAIIHSCAAMSSAGSGKSVKYDRQLRYGIKFHVLRPVASESDNGHVSLVMMCLCISSIQFCIPLAPQIVGRPRADSAGKRVSVCRECMRFRVRAAQESRAAWFAKHHQFITAVILSLSSCLCLFHSGTLRVLSSFRINCRRWIVYRCRQQLCD